MLHLGACTFFIERYQYIISEQSTDTLYRVVADVMDSKAYRQKRVRGVVAAQGRGSRDRKDSRRDGVFRLEGEEGQESPLSRGQGLLEWVKDDRFFGIFSMREKAYVSLTLESGQEICFL
jgi:hypothetical protein